MKNENKKTKNGDKKRKDWFSEIGKVREKMVFAYSGSCQCKMKTKTKNGDKKTRDKRKEK